jgi:hypothetical protein
MPRYTLGCGGDVARKQYRNLPESTRRLVDRRIEELLEDPTGSSHLEYDEQFDQYSIPIGEDKGWIVYAVVAKVRVVIPLRYLPGLE